MDRILFLLAADSWEHAATCVEHAMNQAAVADRISLGLCLQETPSTEAQAAMHHYGAVRFLPETTDAFANMPALWQGERYVLLGSPALSFSKNWDLSLIHSLRSCPGYQPENMVLTGWLPSPEDQLDAVCPVAADRIGRSGLHFRKGTPLHNAAAPQTAAFLHPGFVFGPAAFFRNVAESTEPAFVTAHQKHYTLMTLNRPVLHFLWPQHVSHVSLPETEATRRCCEWFGIDRADRRLSPQARMGLFTADLRFPQHFPLQKRLRERWKRFVNRNNPSTPLCMTYHRQQEEAGPLLPEEQLRRFSWLVAMEDVELVCYADYAVIKRLMPYTANILEYRSRHALPLSQIAEGLPKDALPDADTADAARLGIPFLMAHTSETFLNHSHLVWVDFDYLSFPMYPQTSLDWEILCTDRIVLALVAGKPDISMIVIPQELLADVCRYARTYCTVSLQQTLTLPQAQALWAALLRDQPDWFDCIDLPAERQLFGMMLPSGEMNE